MMTTGDIGEVTLDGKDIEVVTKVVFLGTDYARRKCGEEE